MASTIDTSTKVTIGLIVASLSAVASVTWSIASLKTEMEGTREDVKALRESGEKGTAALLRMEESLQGLKLLQAVHSRDFEALKAEHARDMDRVDKRLDALESKVTR